MRRRIQSFRHALAGLRTLLRTQPNARIHLAATVAVVGMGGVLRVSPVEWALLFLAVGMVWMAEALNTGIEFLADELTLERRERIRHAKDIAAFGVLVAALASAGIGCLVFGPRLLAYVIG